LIVVDDAEAKARLSDYSSLGDIYSALGWTSQGGFNFPNSGGVDDDIRITVAARGDNPAYTIDLADPFGVLPESFLFLTESEARDYVEDFLAGTLDGGDGTVGPDIL
jgi:hypothetical protein